MRNFGVEAGRLVAKKAAAKPAPVGGLVGFRSSAAPHREASERVVQTGGLGFHFERHFERAPDCFKRRETPRKEMKY